MVAQTFVSLHLYGYGTVLATIQKIFTTDGRRPRSTTRFYNGFGVDSIHMTTEGMEVQLARGLAGAVDKCVLLAQWITWLTRDRCNPKVPGSIPAGGKDFP